MVAHVFGDRLAYAGRKSVGQVEKAPCRLIRRASFAVVSFSASPGEPLRFPRVRRRRTIATPHWYLSGSHEKIAPQGDGLAYAFRTSVRDSPFFANT